MGKSMRHLFIMGTILDDITLCCNYIRGSNKGPTMLTAFILFVLLSSFTMLNMLIGILCEVVCATGEGERNANTEIHVREAITDLFTSMDKDNNGEITRDEFLSMKSDLKVMNALKELDVKGKHFEMYADLMFKPEDGGSEIPTINFERTINMIMRLRPGTKVSALDFASFQMTVHRNHDSLRKHITNIEKMASVLSGEEPAAGSPLGLTDANRPEVPAEASPSAKITTSAMPQLQSMSEQDILNELQHRIASFTVNGNQPPAATAQAFTNSLPGNPDLAWSQELYTC